MVTTPVIAGGAAAGAPSVGVLIAGGAGVSIGVVESVVVMIAGMFKGKIYSVQCIGYVLKICLLQAFLEMLSFLVLKDIEEVFYFFFCFCGRNGPTRLLGR